MADKENDVVTNETIATTETTETIQTETTEANNQGSANNQNNVENPNYYAYDKNVEQKEYTEVHPIIKGMPEGFKIPTVKMVRPVVDLNQKPASEEKTETNTSSSNTAQTNNAGASSQQQTQNTQTDTAQFVNPSGLDYLEKRRRAERLADMCLTGYAQIKGFAYMALSLDDEKMRRRAVKGKFDLRALELELEISGEIITVREFLEDYDRGIRKALQIEKDGRCHLDEYFVKQVRPALSDYFEKKGYGASEEANLGYLVLMDFIKTTTQLVGYAANKNVVLHKVSEALQESEALNTDDNLQQTYTHSEPTPPPPPPPPAEKENKPLLNTQISANEADKTLANIHGTNIESIKNNAGAKPQHSIPQNHQLAKVPGKKGRKLGSKDSKKRDNTNYLKSNRAKATKKVVNSDPGKAIKNKPKDELLDFVNEA